MSDLPTLWVSPVESTSGAQTGRWTREPSGPMTRPYVAKTNHVPRDELDAANKMAGELGRLMVTRDLERDAARMALVVAEGKLDAANLEIARLKAQVSNAVANLEEAQILFASIRQADALAPWACESEPGEDSFDEQVCEILRDLEKITGFAARQRTALTPKEPSDV